MKELIAKTEFFSGLDGKIIKELVDASIKRQFRKDETVERQEEMGLGLFIISRGRVRVDREQGGQKQPVAELGPGQFFGEMSLLDDKPRLTTVTSVENTECLLLTRESFVRLMNKFPDIPIRIARVLADRLRLVNEQIVSAPFAASLPANGAHAEPSHPEDVQPQGVKARVHKSLLDAFSRLYAMKALTRFSVAVLGCPVEGVSLAALGELRMGEVKAILFQAGPPFEMRVQARRTGRFSLDVFTPGASSRAHFGSVEIAPGDEVVLRVEDGKRALRTNRGSSGRACVLTRQGGINFREVTIPLTTRDAGATERFQGLVQ